MYLYIIIHFNFTLYVLMCEGQWHIHVNLSFLSLTLAEFNLMILFDKYCNTVIFNN